MKGNGGRMRSSVVIGRLLDSEGFTDHTANQIERYWKKMSGLNERQQKQIERIERELGEFMKDQPDSVRLLLGRFIGLHKKMSFDTGLRMGLAAFAARVDKEVPDESAFRAKAMKEGERKPSIDVIAEMAKHEDGGISVGGLMGDQCGVCGIGFCLPSGRCDHCNAVLRKGET